jgi:hypothetical protein
MDEWLTAVAQTGNELADKGYDKQASLAAISALGPQAIILIKKSRFSKFINRNFYRDRNKVKHLFTA